MADFHAAIVHPADDVPDTYCGVVSQEHVDAVVAACESHPDRWVKPGRGGGVYVLREDGDLDHYLPVGSVGSTVERNTSGSPEPVLTLEQLQARERAAD